MKLTALEIKQQTFEKAFRGYDIAEVQSFLALIASEWEHLTGKVRELEGEIGKLNEKLKHFERVESALHETLQTAKDSSEQKLAGVKKESINILEKAEKEADGIVREAYQQRQLIRQSILRLLDRREEIISGINSYLDIAQESLQKFSKDEASLFKVPAEDMEDEPESTRASSAPAERDEASKKGKDVSDPPAVEKMDDILDEID